MVETSTTLLAQIKDLRDSKSWRRFVELYGPLLYRYARLRGLSREDADEVKQNCLAQLVEVMPRFEYEPQRGKFKTWLYCVANNKIRDLFKRRRPSNLSSDNDAAQQEQATSDDLWEEQWELKHLRYCVPQVLAKAHPTTRRAFELYVISDWPADRVAATLKISVDQVYAAKSRILHRLRQRMLELPGQE